MNKLIEMARESGLRSQHGEAEFAYTDRLEYLEALIRADERAICIKCADDQWVKNPNISGGDAIRKGSCK